MKCDVIVETSSLCTKSVTTADTHYWQLSPVDLYDELKQERVNLF